MSRRYTFTQLLVGRFDVFVLTHTHTHTVPTILILTGGNRPGDGSSNWQIVSGEMLPQPANTAPMLSSIEGDLVMGIRGEDNQRQTLNALHQQNPLLHNLLRSRQSPIRADWITPCNREEGMLVYRITMTKYTGGDTWILEICNPQ